jgi:hypothetical protein
MPTPEVPPRRRRTVTTINPTPTASNPLAKAISHPPPDEPVDGRRPPPAPGAVEDEPGTVGVDDPPGTDVVGGSVVGHGVAVTSNVHDVAAPAANTYPSCTLAVTVTMFPARDCP